jgi:hypothetical protein
VTAAIKAVLAAGVAVMQVEIDKSGKIVVIAGKSDDGVMGHRVGGEWDNI